MKLKHIYFLTFLIIVCNYAFSIDSDTTKLDCDCQPALKIPFRTIINLEVQIVDGCELMRKSFQDKYLLKVVSINGIPQNDSIIMSFKDETGQFPKIILSCTKKHMDQKQVLCPPQRFKN